jgi:ribose/xylose/arabinose/galactoside ABC-type transport system permease subunit
LKKNRSRFLSNRIAFLAMTIVVLVVVLSFISPYFLSLRTLLDMTQFGAVLALLGIGQTLVIMGGRGGIDLSVGSIMSLTGVLMAMLVRAGMNIWLACMVCVCLGIMFGLVNGFLVAWMSLPPLIATLGTSYIFSSVALVITNGVPVSGLPDGFAFVGQGHIVGIPAQVVLVVIPAFLVFTWLVTRTTFGRKVQMVGVNDVAANLVGINTRSVRTVLYGISGALAALGAIVMTSWLMGAKPDIGVGYDMQSITVAVLGGTSMAGGTGNLLGTLMAVVVITMIAYGLQLGNVPSVWQLAVVGMLLVGALVANNCLERRRR